MDYDLYEAIDSERLSDNEIVSKYGQQVADEYQTWIYYNIK